MLYQNSKLYQNKGFTLIEMVVYMALFSIIMGGLVVTAYQLSQSAISTTSKVGVGEEINFVSKKLDWALADASDIILPSASSIISDTLKVNKTDFLDNPIIFRLDITDPNYHFVEFCINNTDCDPITTQNVKVDNLSFEYLPSQGEAKEGVKTIITINGIVVSTTKYLR